MECGGNIIRYGNTEYGRITDINQTEYSINAGQLRLNWWMGWLNKKKTKSLERRRKCENVRSLKLSIAFSSDHEASQGSSCRVYSRRRGKMDCSDRRKEKGENQAPRRTLMCMDIIGLKWKQGRKNQGQIWGPVSFLKSYLSLLHLLSFIWNCYSCGSVISGTLIPECDNSASNMMEILIFYGKKISKFLPRQKIDKIPSATDK